MQDLHKIRAEMESVGNSMTLIGLQAKTARVVRDAQEIDERNTEEYNLALGEKRARSAYDYMVSLGIPKDRLSIISFGETRPVALGHNEEAWRQNRRCDLVVVN